MLGGASSLLCGRHIPVRDGVCCLVVGVEALRVRFDKASSLLSVCCVSKEVIAEASEAPVVTANLCAAHAGMFSSARKQPKVASLSPLCSSQT